MTDLCDRHLTRSRFHGALALHLCNPSVRNALSPDTVAQLRQIVDSAATDGERMLIIRSEGPAFSAGMDLRGLSQGGDQELFARFADVQRLLDDISSAPFVSIAVLDGPAVGAGADLALACDYRIATTSTRFQFPGSRAGVVLGVPRFLSIVGGLRAAELLSGCWVSAEQAASLGLVTDLVASPAAAERRLEEVCCALDAIDRSALGSIVATARTDARPGLEVLEQSLRPGLHARFSADRAPQRRT